MEGDVGVMEGDISTFQADIQRVSDAISTLRQDQQTYLSDSASTGYRSTGVPTDSQVRASISSANGAVAKVRASFQSARSQAAQLVAQAKGYVAQADAICKRAGG
jgi:uncharacterized phage infection (PIP) family protein YhgE